MILFFITLILTMIIYKIISLNKQIILPTLENCGKIYYKDTSDIIYYYEVNYIN